MSQFLTKNVLTLQDKELWSSYLQKLPESMQDVYYTPEYYELYEKNGDGKAFCFVYEEKGNLALYPFLLNRINDLGYDLDGEYYDIQGAYGYNGVVYSSDNPEFIRNFYNEFNQFCAVNNIVAEFTRFNPLINNHLFSTGFLEINFNRKIVFVDLTKPYDEIKNNYSRKARRDIKKAEESGLSVMILENDPTYINEFISMYTETMNKVKAKKYLYFNHKYFVNLFSELSVTQFIVFKDKIPVASSLCLFGKDFFYGHLGCSKAEYWSLGPNSLIYDAKIKYASKNNFKLYNLGGGRSTLEDDSLLRFKEKFSKTHRDFFIGKKIHNKNILDNIYSQWNKNHSDLIDTYKNVLLRYRNFFILLISIILYFK